MALHVLDEANHCLNCKNPACQKACPINTPIPKVISLLKEKDTQGVTARLNSTVENKKLKE